MTNDQLNSTGYIVVDSEVIAITYRSYLNDYDNSEHRMWAQEIQEKVYDGRDKLIGEEEYNNLDEEEQEYYSHITETGSGVWEIWSQKINRNAERCTWLGTFDSEDEADLAIYDRVEWYYVSEKNWDAPIFWGTEEEAADDIIEAMADQFDIDKDVAASIYSKKIRVDAKRKELAIAHRAKVTAEYEARKAWLVTAVSAEADTIEIDNAFIEAMKTANQLSGNEKSSHCARSFKALLERNNIIEIKSDFWQVFRVLKAKAEKV